MYVVVSTPIYVFPLLLPMSFTNIRMVRERVTGMVLVTRIRKSKVMVVVVIVVMVMVVVPSALPEYTMAASRNKETRLHRTCLVGNVCMTVQTLPPRAANMAAEG